MATTTIRMYIDVVYVDDPEAAAKAAKVLFKDSSIGSYVKNNLTEEHVRPVEIGRFVHVHKPGNCRECQVGEDRETEEYVR